MVDFIYDKLKQTNDLKIIVKELLEDIISPDYVKSSKIYIIICNYSTYRWCWM